MSYSANKKDLRSGFTAITIALINLAIIVYLTSVVITHLVVGHFTVLFLMFLIFPLITLFVFLIIFAKEMIAGKYATDSDFFYYLYFY